MERDDRKWIVAFLATFIVATIGGWFLPDGLNDITRAFGQPTVAVTPLTRFFSLALLFAILAALDLLLWLRNTSRKAMRDVDATVRASLAQHTAELTESALLRSIVPYGAQTPDDAAESARLIKAFGVLLSSIPPQLLAGHSVLVRAGLARIGAELHAVARTGINVDIEQHLQITRRFVQANGSFTQINRKAYLVPDEWTQEWLHLVDEFGKRSPPPEYIVLMRDGELRDAADKIRSTATYLHDRGWSFRCCDLGQVEDSLGDAAPDYNVDVYGEIAAKLHPSPPGRYRGSVTFDLKLIDLAGETDLVRFIAAVRRFARAPTNDWPTGGHVQSVVRPAGS
jgi:hypothetical protein